MAMTIDGMAYLLVTEWAGKEYVMRYTDGEMAELFNPGELKDFGRGLPVIRGACRYVDMLGAARLVRD